jgi:hypothetical protein
MTMMAVGAPAEAETVATTVATTDDDNGDDGDVSAYSIGVVAQGLRDGNSVTLVEGDQSIQVDENDTLFSFPESRADGSAYQVLLESTPSDQSCEVLNGEGQIQGEDVEVAVQCQDGPMITSATVNQDEITVVWEHDEALGEPDSYDVSWSSTAISTSQSEPGIYGDGDSAIDVTAPFVITDLDLDRNWYVTVTAHYGDEQRSSTVARRLSGLAFEGELRASQALPDGRVALGGDFAFAGQSSGSLARLDARDGQLMPFPQVDGDIRALLVDNEGHTYVGGDFSRIGSISQPWLARLRPDGRVDESWRPTLNGSVHALIPFEGKLAVGGDFSAVDGDSSQAHLTILDDDAQALPAWSGLGLDGRVATLSVFQGLLVAGGEFDISGASHLAAFNAEAEIQPIVGANGAVQTLLAWDDRLFVGGYFEQVDGVERQYLAALDEGLSLDSWTLDIRPPDPNDYDGLPPIPRVSALTRHNDWLLLGGVFGDVESEDRRNLAAVNLDGEVQDWNPSAFGGSVDVILPWNDRIVVGGQYRDIARLDQDTARENYRVSRLALLSLDELDGDGIPLASDQFPLGADGPVLAAAGTHQQLIVGGSMGALGYWSRGASGLAFLDADGKLDTEQEHFVSGGGIRDFTLFDGDLYAVGDFERFDHPDLAMTQRFAIRFGSDGNIDTGWSIARPEPPVLEAVLGVSPYLVLGGNFEEFLLQGQVHRLAALDANGNLEVSWRSGDGPNDRVLDLALLNDTVYAAGVFSIVLEDGEEEPRAGYAAFDADDGTLTAWSPAHGDEAGTLASHDGELILAIEDNGDWSVGVADLPGNTVDTDIGANDSVHRLESGNAGLFLFGAFTTLEDAEGGSHDRPGVARLNLEAGSLNVDGFAPDNIAELNGEAGIIHTAFSVGGRICLAGRFARIGERSRSNLACFEGDGSLGD